MVKSAISLHKPGSDITTSQDYEYYDDFDDVNDLKFQHRKPIAIPVTYRLRWTGSTRR